MVTENELELSAVPFAVVTEITPVVAPSGTVVVIERLKRLQFAGGLNSTFVCASSW